MAWKNWQFSGMAVLFVLALLCGVRAEDVKATDEGQGADFKGKTVEMKNKGEFAITLSFSAGKEITATTKGTRQTDVHLFAYDPNGKEVGKANTPGPTCEVKFKPAKDGKYKFVVKNSGGTNSVTLDVKVTK